MSLLQILLLQNQQKHIKTNFAISLSIWLFSEFITTILIKCLENNQVIHLISCYKRMIKHAIYFTNVIYNHVFRDHKPVPNGKICYKLLQKFYLTFYAPKCKFLFFMQALIFNFIVWTRMKGFKCCPDCTQMYYLCIAVQK